MNRVDTRWTKDEDDFLAENLAQYGMKLCADTIGRSQGGIYMRAWKLGIMDKPAKQRNGVYSPKSRKKWSNKDRKFIRDNPDMTNAQIAEALGRTIDAVKGAKYEMRISDLPNKASLKAKIEGAGHSKKQNCASGFEPSIIARFNAQQINPAMRFDAPRAVVQAPKEGRMGLIRTIWSWAW